MAPLKSQPMYTIALAQPYTSNKRAAIQAADSNAWRRRKFDAHTDYAPRARLEGDACTLEVCARIVIDFLAIDKASSATPKTRCEQGGIKAPTLAHKDPEWRRTRDETATHAHASRGGGGLMNAPAPNPHTDHCAGRCKCRRRHSAGDDQVLQYPKAKHCGVSRAQGTELHGETIQMSQPPPANRWSNPWRARFRRVGSDSASEHAPWD